MEELWVGVDVSKSLVAVHIRPTNESFSCQNDASGVAFLVARLQQLVPKLIVLEATGGHEVLLANELVLAQLPVAVVNPAHARNFARALGRLAKTDPIDAMLLAHFAEAIRPEVRVLPDQQAQELSDLITRRRQLIELLVAERALVQSLEAGFVLSDFLNFRIRQPARLSTVLTPWSMGHLAPES